MNKREYIQANMDWLEAKSKEDGVKALPKGIHYKVLSEGNQSSATPTVRSIITAHYTGKTIDGISALPSVAVVNAMKRPRWFNKKGTSRFIDHSPLNI